MSKMCGFAKVLHDCIVLKDKNLKLIFAKRVDVVNGEFVLLLLLYCFCYVVVNLYCFCYCIAFVMLYIYIHIYPFLLYNFIGFF